MRTEGTGHRRQRQARPATTDAAEQAGPHGLAYKIGRNGIELLDMDETVSIYDAAIEAARLTHQQRERVSMENSRTTDHACVLIDTKGSVIARVSLESCRQAQGRILKKRIEEKKAELGLQWLTRKIDSSTYQKSLAELPPDSPTKQAAGVLTSVLLSIAAFWAAATLLGVGLKGCEYLKTSSEENKTRALNCASASEDVSQIKKLRDNGFASESQVRSMEQRRTSACTW